ncbi:phosphoribosylformylglycinamidine synthase II, partial [bacterium]|nr:phosphoribosylformylglycinamidine synthase II [bacterium]
GGLTGSGAEMAGASGHGALINLETVPTRIAGLTPYEIALSESQERVLFCISPSEVPKVIRLAKKWDLRAADVGEVTSTGKIEMAWKGERVCHLPISLIEDGPKYDRPRTPLPPPPIAPSSPCPPDPVAFLNQMAARPNIARKAWVWEQYDSQVQANTVVKQGRDAGVLQVEGKRGIALSADAKPMWCLADPYWGAAHTVVEGAFNVAVRGARPLGITNCLNFGNPEKPSVMEAFSQAVDGISAASRAMDTPITGGNVSFYNESPGGAIPPTPTIGMVGVISDLDGMRGRSPQVGDQIMLLGNTEDWTLAGSEALQALVPDLPATLPPLNLEEARETLERLLVVAPHTAWLSDLSEGGLFDAFLRLLPLGMGASLSCPLDGDWLSFLFSEAPARVVFGISEGEEPPRESLSVGVVTGDDRLACSGWSAPLGPIREAWEGFFPHLIEGKLG